MVITANHFLAGEGTEEDRKEFLEYCEWFVKENYPVVVQWSKKDADDLKQLYEYCLKVTNYK